MSLDTMMARFETAVARLEAMESRMGGEPGPKSASPAVSQTSAAGPKAKSVTDYEAFIEESVQPFVKNCKSSNEKNIQTIGDITLASFKFVGTMIQAGTVCAKPTDSELQGFTGPLSKLIQQALALVNNRNKTFFHESGFGEAIQALQWVVIPLPQAHVQGALEASTFYLNKVLTSTDDEQNKQFVKLLRAALNQLKAYIKVHHTTAFAWTTGGKPIKTFAASSAVVGSAPPPPMAPPMAPPAAPAPAAPKSAPSTGGGMGAVFSEISKGSAITSGLKKVTADMKTKNRPKDERSGFVTVKQSSTSNDSYKKAASTVAVKEPNMTLTQGKWFIEHYVNAGVVTLPEEAQVNQPVYIYKCSGTTIRLPNKVKAICMDSCSKTVLIFQDVVSTVEIVNCQAVEVGCIGITPIVAIDKTHGCQLALSQACLDMSPSVVTSNISEVNIRMNGKTDKDDPIEVPVPEQFITKLKGVRGAYTLVTDPVSHGG